MIAGIILAAGSSSRMGSPKALLEYRGETFAQRLVRIFSMFCEPVIVVAGYHADAIRGSIRANIAVNPAPDRGQLSSLQTALATLPNDCEGFLFTPVDCPAPEPETIAALVEAFRKRDEATPVVIPRYHGRRGHPVCVAGNLIAEFLAAPPASETREVVRRHTPFYVDVDDRGVLADVDDPESYRALVS